MIRRRGFITGLVLLIGGAAQAQSITATGSASISFSNVTSCAIATIGFADRGVEIDWKCVAELAQKYRDGRSSETVAAYAHVLQAIHDGEAKSR